MILFSSSAPNVDEARLPAIVAFSRFFTMTWIPTLHLRTVMSNFSKVLCGPV